MPSVSVKLYSVFFKTLLKHKLLHTSLTSKDGSWPAAVVLGQSHRVPADASFVDGVATKDINLDPSLTLRIFLPESALPREPGTPGNTGLFGCLQNEAEGVEGNGNFDRRASHDGSKKSFRLAEHRRNSWGGEHGRRLLAKKEYARLNVCNSFSEEESVLVQDGANPYDAHDDRGNYQGYHPDFIAENNKRLPIIIQFHGGGFVTGSKDSASNDCFCRRMAKLCDAIVIAVGYRLAPEHKYPAAFDDGFDALSWIANQANLAECNRSLGKSLGGKADSQHRKSDKELIAAFGGSAVVEPWIAAHGDPSRCVLLGVSSGGNIADFVARKAVQAGRLLEPIKIVAQVLMYPFFVGSVPTQSEIKLANSYFYDKATCILAWKLLFPDGQFSLDHPIANPLVPALRKASLDAPVLEYKDAVHEFATLDFLIKSRQAESCAEDITIWIKKYVSQKGHEFSY
ncbi:hypothetical protein GOP47_0004281 [Adiantum capillus-veneris]|uniref:Alpha/beta hydrolase fold-3 domain-containing protein n=1 Tax=Adiantum capillus-veneris TaxID=13818 RepID=A0A9D4ZMG0_ADICA|nr:hypothetical protein GOP47_0004281 [Adiantum capillus-veneris]